MVVPATPHQWCEVTFVLNCAGVLLCYLKLYDSSKPVVLSCGGFQPSEVLPHLVLDRCMWVLRLLVHNFGTHRKQPEGRGKNLCTCPASCQIICARTT